MFVDASLLMQEDKNAELNMVCVEGIDVDLVSN